LSLPEVNTEMENFFSLNSDDRINDDEVEDDENNTKPSDDQNILHRAKETF